MPTVSPAHSLFASDYSLSTSGTPASPQAQARLSSISSATRLDAASPVPSRQGSIAASRSLRGSQAGSQRSLPVSPTSISVLQHEDLDHVPDLHDDDPLSKRKSSTRHIESPAGSLRASEAGRRSSKGVGTSAKGRIAQESFDGAMEGGLGHENRSSKYKVGTEKAYYHLNRALDYFDIAVGYKPNSARAILGRAKILINLSTNYQPPKVATQSLVDAVRSLRKLSIIAPQSVSARETLAQANSLLSGILLDTDDAADDGPRLWDGQIGQLAREAMQNMEEVAADRMERLKSQKSEESAEQAPELAEMFLFLSETALNVAALAPDLSTVEDNVEVAEHALDQASNMATIAAAARVKSSSSSANLITKVQLASGKSSMERLRRTFALGVNLDEDDFRSLLADMTMLANECRERALKRKGSKAAAASTLAWEALRQLGDAKVLYACLLRLVWRKRRTQLQRHKGDVVGRGSRKLSARTDSMEATIKEEREDEEDDKKTSGSSRGSGSSDEQLRVVPVLGKGDHVAALPHLSPNNQRRFTDLRRDSGNKSGSRKGSALDAMPEESGVSVFSPGGRKYSIGASPRRGSWMAEQSPASRSRRLSSMSASLSGSDGGGGAWSRKASVISLAEDDAAAGLVPSSELAMTAFELLDDAMKQYKLALTFLKSCDLPSVHLARAKADTLTSISYVSLFMATLWRRVAPAADKRNSLLVTSEVYSTWAAREVGWSFLIEGTKEAAAADRRTNSWRGDECGKFAVMLLLRTWWFRAVTTVQVDTETKAQAKDAVEVVVRRMRDREGVRDGDVRRFRMWLIKYEGELEQTETLFWRAVSRILRGGSGFVMS